MINIFFTCYIYIMYIYFIYLFIYFTVVSDHHVQRFLKGPWHKKNNMRTIIQGSVNIIEANPVLLFSLYINDISADIESEIRHLC